LDHEDSEKDCPSSPMEDKIFCNKRINELIMRDHFLGAPYAKIRFKKGSPNLGIYITVNEYEVTKKL
jgi:hypothetical protein